MLALIQRVTSASVSVENSVVGSIDHGLLLLLGVEKEDTDQHAARLLQKVLSYRVFSDADGKMNLSLKDVDGGLLVVSQFTLAASTDKGLRPSFSSAKPPAEAEQLYEYFLKSARNSHATVAAGKFGANMQVALVNDGPVTFLLKS
ncbi:MAG TPA: D-aminoacyl-tRNA deacylase [Candidatus Acidoferrum sp.]|nr:D-aminoacyl-tRNA deacylase [Candidatus Acidoferrum sp.]